MVDVYTNTRSKFTVGDRDHNLFNPRDLSLWVMQLLRYEIVSLNTFLHAWAYETNRIFRDRLVGAESQDQFDSMLRNAMIYLILQCRCGCGCGEALLQFNGYFW